MTIKLPSLSITTLITTLITVPVVIAAIAVTKEDSWLVAQTPTPYHLVLASGSDLNTAVVIGQTGGSYSLASIAQKDKNGNHCMGYSDPDPDHIMTLQNDFAQLSLQVNSGGKDTTLVIKGPDNQIRCAFGKKQDRDALLSDTNWSQGQYEIWVGAMQPQQRSNYRLSVQQ